MCKSDNRELSNSVGELGCDKMNIGIVEENKVLRKWYEKVERR